jgi:hypothetical protein
MTNNILQNTRWTTGYCATRTSQKAGDELRCFGRVGSSYSTESIGIRRATTAKNLVISPK